MRLSFPLVPLGLLFSLATACGSPPPAEGPQKPVATPSASATAPAASSELDRPLPLDQRVRKGKLASGLTYYVMAHGKPEKRAQVWLAVDAGSVLEDEDQRGLAHFVEHMGFNGTKRFPKQQLVDFLEKSGVRFGADLNAYTSFDETVYTLQVPTDDSKVLNRSIEVLRDWADGIAFEPAEVEKERGVVLEEWRLGRGARMRIFDKQAPIIFHGSRYAERLTIGKPEVIKGASRDKLVRFYRDWYRPDLMAVIAVGDFDAAAVEERIKSEFGSLAAPAKPRPRTREKLPPHAKTLVSIETDPELPSTTVAVLSKLPHRPEASARDYRRSLTEQLVDSMLNARLDELKRMPDAPFLGASSATSGLVRTADSFRQSASVKEDGVVTGLSALLEEVLRVERHGFTKTELERAKSQLLRQFQQAVKERDKRDGGEFASEITRNFFENEAMPGREAELRLVEGFLPEIQVDELNGLAKQLGAGSRVLVVTGPDKIQKPKPDELLALHDRVAKKQIDAYVDVGSNQPLVATPPAPGSITKRSSIPEIGVTEWTLSNGARVVVKPTDFANDQVRASAFSPGGHSLAKDADFESARFADVAVGQGGLGAFDAVQLKKALAGKLVSVNANISELEEGLSGRASPADLETLLQMMHLAFVAPRRDARAFVAWRAREAESVKNRRLSPEGTFFEDMAIFSSQNHLRRRPVTPETLEKVDLDKALAIYKDRFADASDFTFVFVGNVKLETLEPLVATYLASLPGKKRKESWRDPKVSLPLGVKTKTVKKGSEPKSMVTLTFHGTEKWTRDTENDMRMLGEVLRLRLRQVLREDMGGVYGVQVGGGITRRPRQEYRFGVTFGCAPENVTKLEQAVFDEIAAIQKNGVDPDYISKVKEARRRAHETELRDNGYWLRELERAYAFSDDPRLIPDISPMIDKVSSDRVKAAANKYISKKQYILGVLEPETKP
ncbi:MAG: insulinase family protein [Polyangiaceae bacterium]